MPKIAKILLLDKEWEKISEEDFEKYKEEYARYSLETFEFVNKLKGIPSKEAKDTIFNHLLSPFQYFLEDKIRNTRLDKGKLVNPWDRPFKK